MTRLRREQSTDNEIPVANDNSVTTPPKLNPANGVTDTPKHKSEVQVRKSLNPFSPDYEENPKYVSYSPVDNSPEVKQTSDSPPHKATVEDLFGRLADILSRRKFQDNLPLPEPETFSGDFLHYPVWLKSFETIIEGQTQEVSQRLYYLGRYTSGKPKEAISGLLLLDTAEAYKQAKKILADRFGNPSS